MSTGLTTSTALTTHQPLGSQEPLGDLAWHCWRALHSPQDITWPWTSWVPTLAAFWSMVPRTVVWNGHTALGLRTPQVLAHLLSSPRLLPLLLALPQGGHMLRGQGHACSLGQTDLSRLSGAVGPGQVAFILLPPVLPPSCRALQGIEMTLGIPSLVRQWSWGISFSCRA